MKKIHEGFLLTYDYLKLKIAIPLVYEYADRIFIAQDENFTTWNGNKFQVEDDFFLWLKQIDTKNKIELYKDNFYIPELTAIQNDTRERHMLSMKMGIGNWLIQIDNELPKSLNEEVFIPMCVYHRLIKGDGDLKLLLKKIK